MMAITEQEHHMSLALALRPSGTTGKLSQENNLLTAVYKQQITEDNFGARKSERK